MSAPTATEKAVQERYAAAAASREQALCCPVDYNQELLKIIPEEVIAKDYGCGDPSRFLKPGERVLDLGSGTGKICFIAAQVVGKSGSVIGVDMTDDMLEVARRNQPIVAERLGYANVEFRKGRIQDLALDLEYLDQELSSKPINGSNAFLAANEFAEECRQTNPLIPDQSVDVVVSNCVLNLVDPKAKRDLFLEIYRVCRVGGRAVISDIVSDEPVPATLQADPELWSGCISGALTESGFLQAFAEAGFQGIEILKRDPEPWQTVEGIEFFSVTVQAHRLPEGEEQDLNQAAIYLGPFQKVMDDQGRWFERGERHAISSLQFEQYQQPPYADHFAIISPKAKPSEATAFNAVPGQRRSSRESKGINFKLTTAASDCCTPGPTDCC